MAFMGIFLIFLLPAIIVLYILHVAFRWIMAFAIISSLFWCGIEILIYNILKRENIFDDEYLEKIKQSKYGKYKKIFLVLLKNGLKISIVFFILIICICSIAFYINPF